MLKNTWTREFGGQFVCCCSAKNLDKYPEAFFGHDSGENVEDCTLDVIVHVVQFFFVL